MTDVDKCPMSLLFLCDGKPRGHIVTFDQLKIVLQPAQVTFQQVDEEDPIL